MKTCEICNKKFKTQQGLNSHIGWHNNPRNMKKENNPHYGKKGANQYTYGKKFSELTKKKISIANKGRIQSIEEKKMRSIAMKKAVINNPESYSSSNVCGRTKLYEYKDFKLNGKWELIIAKWLDIQNIKWTNKIKGFEYNWNNSTHLYFPDFYLEDLNLFIEVKGYERERDKCKWKNMQNLIIFRKKEIELIEKDYNIPIAKWNNAT